MSLLWRDRLQVFFAPGQVSVARSPRGLKYKGLKYKGLKFRGLEPKPTTVISAVCEQKPGGALWESPLEELERCLGEAAGTDAVITISNHFVRYAVLAAQKDIANPAELHAYAEFHMHEIFGERAEAWMLSVGTWDPYSGGVCAAIERDLFDRLEELIARNKMRLRYVEPYLTSAFDHCRKRFEDNRSWFALVETGRLCLALLEDGAWQHIRNQRIVHDIKDELLAALDQEAILFSTGRRADETVYVLAPEHAQLTLPEDCGWRTALLQPDQMPLPLHYLGLTGADGAKLCAASG